MILVVFNLSLIAAAALPKFTDPRPLGFLAIRTSSVVLSVPNPESAVRPGRRNSSGGRANDSRHCLHPDRRFAPSECRLQRAIQYSQPSPGFMMAPKRRTECPALVRRSSKSEGGCAGHDDEGTCADQFRLLSTRA